MRALERAYAKAGVSPGHGRPGRGPRDRHRRRRPAEVETAATGSSARRRGTAELCHRLGQVDDRPHQVHRRGRRPDQDRLSASTTGCCRRPRTCRAEPRARFGDSPFYVNTETRPWVSGVAGQPRRAGISAFGFGGTISMPSSEYTGDFLAAERTALVDRAAERAAHLGGGLSPGSPRSRRCPGGALREGARPKLRDVAYTLWRSAPRSARLGPGHRGRFPRRPRGEAGPRRAGAARSGARRPTTSRGFTSPNAPSPDRGVLRFCSLARARSTRGWSATCSTRFPELRDRFAVADRVLGDPPAEAAQLLCLSISQVHAGRGQRRRARPDRDQRGPTCTRRHWPGASSPARAPGPPARPVRRP